MLCETKYKILKQCGGFEIQGIHLTVKTTFSFLNSINTHAWNILDEFIYIIYKCSVSLHR